MEIKIATRHCVDDMGAQRRFHYFLTIDHVSSGPFCYEDYGVRINEENANSCTVPSITTSAMRIDELMSLLIEHTVGPIGLEDVVSDWL